MIKFIIYFSLSFLILSFPVKQKRLFNILDSYTSPVVNDVYVTILDTTQDTFNKSIRWVKGIFKSSRPKTDAVSTGLSATTKQSRYKKLKTKDLTKKSEETQHEVYSREELIELENMLKESEI